MDTIQNESKPNEQRKELKKLEQQYEKKIQELLNLAEQVQQYKQNVQSSLNKLEQEIFQKTSLLIEMKNKISCFKTEQQEEEIYQQENKLNYVLIEINDNISNKLKDLESFAKLDKLSSSLNNFKSDQIQTIDIDLSYQLISSQRIQYSFLCMSLNHNGTLIIFGYGRLIKVFEINKHQISEAQSFDAHSENVWRLKFLKKSNSFISSSLDNTVIFWEKNLSFSWKSNKILTNEFIHCIAINQNDDLFIFGSKNNQISFWHKNNITWSSSQIIDCEDQVVSISLNNSDDLLIAGIFKKQILIIKFNNLEWQIIQKIELEEKGSKLCSINSNQFVFQKFYAENLSVYNYDFQEKKFIKGQQVQYPLKNREDYDLQLIRYINYIGLIIVKNDIYIHIVKRSQDGQFSVQQSINLQTNYILGDVSDDGRLIVTWDDYSKEIQLRILQY